MTDRNIHEEFCRAMQKAWEESVIDTSDLKDEDIPPPDLSFLDRLYEEEPTAQSRELPFLQSGKKHLTVVISEVKGGSEASLSGKLEQSPVSGIDLYVVLDEKEHEYTITCEEEDIRFAVNAPLSKHEAVKIIEGIKKQDN